MAAKTHVCVELLAHDTMSLAHGLLAAKASQTHGACGLALPGGEMRIVTLERLQNRRTDTTAGVDDALNALLQGSAPPPLPPVYRGVRAAVLDSDAGAARVASRAVACATKATDALAARLDAASPATWASELVALWQQHTERLAMADHILLFLYTSAWFARHGTPLEEASFARLTSHLRQHEGHFVQGICELARGSDERVVRAALAIARRMGLAQSLDVALRASADEQLAQIAQEAYSGEADIEHVAAVLAHEHRMGAWLYTDADARAQAAASATALLVDSHAHELLAAIPRVWATPAFLTVYKLLDGWRDDVRAAVVAHVTARGRAIMGDEAELVERLIGLQREVRMALDGVHDEQLGLGVRAAFEDFVNSRGSRTATQLARFLDAKLRAGNTALSDQELGAYMDDALALFRTLRDKDVFEAVFIRTFARRLLLRRSASADSERALLMRLRGEYGPDFTARLETMLRDMELSEDLMSAYPARRVDAPSGQFTLDVSVLTQAHWPTFHDTPVVLPGAIAGALARFESFYHTRHSGRTLHWRHGLGSCVVTARLGKAGVRDLHVSAFQAVVLLLFNEHASLAYTDILKATALEPAELKRTLQSLACGAIPTRVLRKTPPGRDVADADTFAVNENLQNPRRRIRINQIQMHDSPEEHRAAEQRVFIDRDLVLQAAAMRVLKARKTIRHTELATEVVAQTRNRFSVDSAELKKAFERLIEKDLMERVEGERGVYRYVA